MAAEVLFAFYWPPWLFNWLGVEVLGFNYPIPQVMTGSGDTSMNYTRLFACSVTALLAFVPWSFYDRRRLAYPRLHDGLRVGLRYFMAYAMIGYGLAKVIPNQFPPPSPARLMEPLGDFSPMGLVWNFMGSSTPYEIFGGALELIGGLLLLFRRTTLLGALILSGVMTNVVLLNFCYDVPVKISSTFYLLMVVTLIVPDAPRLLSVILGGRPTEPVPLWQPFRRKGLNRAVIVGKLVVLYYVSSSFWNVPERLRTYLGRDYGRDYGVWMAEGESAWKWFSIDSPTYASIREKSGPTRAYLFDSTHEGLRFKRNSENLDLTLQRNDLGPGRMRLSGAWRGQTIDVTFKLRKVDDFPLRARGFNWVQEVPYNR